jgi:hypothetical protein
MPQHMDPRGLRSPQGAQLRSRRSREGATDISRIQGSGFRKASSPSSAAQSAV